MAVAFPSEEERLRATQQQLCVHRRELYQQMVKSLPSLGEDAYADGIDAEAQNDEHKARVSKLMGQVLSVQIKLFCIALVLDRNRAVWAETRKDWQRLDERLKHVGLGSAMTTLKRHVENLFDKAKDGTPDDLQQLLDELDFHLRVLVDSMVSEAQSGDAEVALPAIVWVDSGFVHIDVLSRAGLTAVADDPPEPEKAFRFQRLPSSAELTQKANLTERLASQQAELYALASTLDELVGLVAAQNNATHHQALDHTNFLFPLLPTLKRQVERLLDKAQYAPIGYLELLSDDVQFHVKFLKDLCLCMD